MGDEPEQEGAVLTQVIVQEGIAQFLIPRGNQAVAIAVTIAQVVLYELQAVPVNQEPEQPDKAAQAGDNGDKHHPEPEEHVDLLVVKVDWQYTLHGVRVDVTKAPHVEITQGDSWKGHELGLCPVVVSHHILHHVDTVPVEAHTEHLVQQEHLANNVQNVEGFGRQEQNHQIVPHSAKRQKTIWFTVCFIFVDTMSSFVDR